MHNYLEPGALAYYSQLVLAAAEVLAMINNGKMADMDGIDSLKRLVTEKQRVLEIIVKRQPEEFNPAYILQ